MPDKVEQQRKMVTIDVDETSGVDHPAHLTEGWVVLKSADKDQIAGLFGPQSTEKGAVMPEKQETETPTVEDLVKALAAKDAELVAAQEALAKATAPKPEEDKQEALLKSVPEEVRNMLKAQADQLEAFKKQAEEDRETLRKAQEAQADKDAIFEMKSMLKAVSVDADKLAPALRLLPEGPREVVKQALRAAEAQLQDSGLFKSVGDSTATGTTAKERIDAATAEVMKQNPGMSRPTAMVKALEADVTLRADYEAEKKAGN
jgi:hypothetical protein